MVFDASTLEGEHVSPAKDDGGVLLESISLLYPATLDCVRTLPREKKPFACHGFQSWQETKARPDQLETFRSRGCMLVAII